MRLLLSLFSTLLFLGQISYGALEWKAIQWVVEGEELRSFAGQIQQEFTIDSLDVSQSRNAAASGSLIEGAESLTESGLTLESLSNVLTLTSITATEVALRAELEGVSQAVLEYSHDAIDWYTIERVQGAGEKVFTVTGDMIETSPRCLFRLRFEG